MAALVMEESLAPVAPKRKHRRRKLVNALLKDLKKPKRRITKPPSERQLAARQRMKRASERAQQIYRSAPKGSMKWIDAVRQAWREL
jgi:hypothetical protein